MRRMREAPVMFWIAMGPIAGLAGYGAWQVLSAKGGNSKFLSALKGKAADPKAKSVGGSGKDTHGDRKVASAPAGNKVEHSEETALDEDFSESHAAADGTEEHAAPVAHVGSARTSGAVKGCAVLEFAGEGPALTKAPREKDWAPVRTAFHKSKAELEAWLDANGEKLPKATLSALKERVKAVRIQRPPTAEEPDLAWRGVAVVSRDERGASLIRVGGGFLRTFQEQPMRARFELTRLITQVALAPCELNRAGLDGETLWRPLANCLNVKAGMNTASCDAQPFSEAGWAVSTALAQKLTPSGCEIPGMAVETGPGCLRQATAWLSGQELKTEGVAGAERSIASEANGHGGAKHAGEHPAAGSH